MSPEQKQGCKSRAYELIKWYNDFILGKQYLTSPGNEQKSSETPFKYFKTNRIKTRRKTNPESDQMYKFQVVPKKILGKSSSK